MLEGSLDGSHYLDVADEEVHFSRLHLAGAFQAQAQTQPAHSLEQPPSSLDSSTSCFTELQLGDCRRPDQLRSSRLLACLGSKLRRGSNYYLAAPKLVGQYLLGITIQSWFEFLDTARLARAPANAQQLTRRLVANLSHFQGNYLCVALVLVIYCVLTSPLLLLAILAYLASLYAITLRTATGRPLRLANFRPNLQQQYSFVTLVSLPLLWVAGAPGALFWVIGASFVVVGLHASMYQQQQQPQQPPNTAPEPISVRPQALGAHRLSVPNFQAPAAYYNHFSPANQYLPVPTSSPAGKPNELANNNNNNRYTSALAQWISFGSSSCSPNAKVNGDAANVTIISQDYAGLGRVYEI